MSIQLTITQIYSNQGRSLFHPWTEEDTRSLNGYIDSEGNLNIPHYKKIEGKCNIKDYERWTNIFINNEQVTLLEAVEEDDEYYQKWSTSLSDKIKEMKVSITNLDRGINMLTEDKLTYTIKFTGRIYS